MPPGATSASVPVSIIPDGVNEPNESFTMNLTVPVHTVFADAQGVATITNDDPPTVSAIELTHGAEQTRNLASLPGPAVHWYRIGQKARASYEVVVDSTSANLGPGLQVRKIAADGSSVFGSPISGLNLSQSLRWQNVLSGAVNGELISVQSGGCTTTCTTDDVYRIRAYETTYSIARFNNSQSQTTVVLIQNPQSYAVSGTIWFWDGTGSLLGSSPFTLAAKALFALSTPSVSGVSGQTGSITVTHNARYGALVGKAVAVEPTTGFAFDTPMLPVRR
jgi:hypothetical protein